ncbi:hypothetical protein Tco_0793443 [Tanacetum coccineum]
MQNTKDTLDPTIAMNMALDRLAKALMLNNQRSGKNIVQNVGRMNGISVDTRIANQHGIRNVVTARAEGNSNGSNDNQITCVNSYEEGHHHASTCTIKLKKLDVAYLQKHIQIAQKEEAGIQLTQKEFDFMDDACASEETERVQMNCTSEDTLQQASTSGTQPDNAPVYDSDGSTEVPNDETCCDNDIFNILPSDVQSTDLQTELDRTKEKLETCIIKKEKEYVIERLQAQLGDLKGKSSDTQCASNTLDLVSQKLEDENMPLESQVLNYAKENAHLKTTYKNLSDSIKVTRDQTKSIIDSLQKQLYDTIYENAKLRAQLFDKKDESNALLKPVTLNSVPPPRESKVVQTVMVIASKIFRTNHSKTSRVDNVVPNKPVKSSVRTKPITTSQPNVIHKQHVNSDSNGFSPTSAINTAKTRRPLPARIHSKSNSSFLSNNFRKIEENHRNLLIPKTQKHKSSECNNIKLAIRNAKSEVVCAMCKQCFVTFNHDVCMLNYVNDMHSRVNNKNANVSNNEKQKKHKANVMKSNKVESKGSLASSRTRKPRTYLRWLPTGRTFDLYGYISSSSNTESESDTSVCENASTSNPQEPTCKRFPSSTSFLSRISNLRRQNSCTF